MINLPVWILTFDRPVALNRLIHNFAYQGFADINIFSNHPRVQIDPLNKSYINKTIINTLNSEESNSWCARSWNTILMKTFDDPNVPGVICIQDDTDIADTFGDWFMDVRDKFDFLWGPAGDQFFYLKRNILQDVGWWDERYIGCYCTDADWLKRVWMACDRSRISVEDSHNWGFRWNESGISRNVITTFQSKTIDPNYDNQHWDFERRCKDNPTLLHSQNHFRQKWAVDLDNGQPVVHSIARQFKEIDWYPWATQKFGIKAYA